MSTSAEQIEFVECHQPVLPAGEYVLTAQQQVHIDGSGYGWGNDPEHPWIGAPSAELRFAVAGPRFSLDPDLIQSQFPPPNSTGEYYNVLPHIIFNRTTLPWERSIDNASNTKPWMALLLFDKSLDGGAPTVTNLTVQELLAAAPDGTPEFVRVVPRTPPPPAGPADLQLEVGQHLNDRLTVIDVPKKLLYQIMPSADDLAKLAHVRRGRDSADPSKKDAEYPVIFCNRLPAPGSPSVGSQSIVHLVSLEGRQPLLDELRTKPEDDKLVRLVSLASWSFSTLRQDKTFSGWLKEAWHPDVRRTDPADRHGLATDPNHISRGAAGMLHTLRMPASENSDAEGFLSQGYVPMAHQTRQGNHLVSWYRGPLVPGQKPASDVALPVRMSDELVRYFGDAGMFDVTYAAAWELGRMLTLRSKQVSIALSGWKRAHAQQVQQAETIVSHLPFAPDTGIAPDFPPQVSAWFDELCRLEHVPFHYLVPREAMLPAGSLRFFDVDLDWLECLLDGAFSIGRIASADMTRDKGARQAGRVPKLPVYSGFLLRSPVVTGWPHLAVEAYTDVIHDVGSNQAATPAKRLRFDRVGTDILLCLFEGSIRTVDIHEHPEAIHFGVDTGSDPNDVGNYSKTFRELDGGPGEPCKPLPWKNDSPALRTLDIAKLASNAKAKNSAEFGVTMIEGVERVRFIRQN